MIRNLLLINILGAALLASATIPSGYYKTIDGKAEAALKTALYQVINPHRQVSSYSNLPQYFQKTDVYPNSSRWWDMYSDIPLYAPSFSGLNREHSLPKSWWGGLTDIPAYVDLNHLYPSEAKANMAKSNYPLGEVTGKIQFENGITTVGVGAQSGGAPYVFEPADEYKGDFARTYFYMVTCYQNMEWTNTWMCRNGTYPSLQTWAIDLLLKWHRADPVSQKELDRNEQVFLVQNNRNPYIDYPDLAEYIWGDKKGQAYNLPGSVTPPVNDGNLITPPPGMTLDFGQTAVGYTSVSQLQFKGENLSGYFELSLAGSDRTQFALSTTRVESSGANSQSGVWINVTYKPAAKGEHSAKLVITDGGLPEGSRIVNLTGQAEPVPTLTAPVAYEPDAIGSDGVYDAIWSVPDGQTIDYCVVTLKRYHSDGTVSTESLPAEGESLEITGLNDDLYHTYTVQTARLGILSAPSNTVTVRPVSAIGTINPDEPLSISSWPGLVMVRCSQPHTCMCVTDALGRTVYNLNEVTDGQVLDLAHGIYFVTTAQHPTPIKVIAY